MQEIVALEQLVRKFRERHPFSKFAIETSLHAVFRHHIVHRDALTNFACKIEETIVLHPFVVVHQFGSIRSIAFKVEEARQLFLDASHVVAQCFFVQQIALSTFARRVANHPRSTSHERKRFVSSLLEMAEHHHATEVTNVK